MPKENQTRAATVRAIPSSGLAEVVVMVDGICAEGPSIEHEAATDPVKVISKVTITEIERAA